MKKFLAAITALVMALTSMSVVWADETVSSTDAATDSDKTWRVMCYTGDQKNAESNGVDTVAFMGRKTDSVKGICQKSSTDGAMYMNYTASSAGNYGNFKIMPYFEYKSTTTGSAYTTDSSISYAVVSTDFCLDSTSTTDVNKVSLCREGGRTAGYQLDLSSVTKDEWHTVTYVIDLTDVANSNISNKCYLDGTYVSGNTVSQYNALFPTQWRIQFYNNAILSNAYYDESGTKVDLSDKTTFTAQSFAISMYIDNFEYYVSSKDPIGTDAVIASYANNFNTQSMGYVNLGSINRSTSLGNVYEQGLGGKDSDDSAISGYMASSGAPLVGYQKLMPQRAYTRFDFNLYISEDSNITSTSYQSGYSVNVADTTIDSFNKGQWNRVTYIFHDLGCVTTDEGQRTCEFYTYVNGNLVGITNQNQKRYQGNSTLPYDIRALIKPLTAGEEVIVDDLSVTQSALPLQPYDTPSLTTNTKSTVENNTVTVSRNVTASALSASTDATVRAFTDDTYQTVTTSALQTGNVVVLESTDGVMAYYNVVNPTFNAEIIRATSEMLYENDGTPYLKLTQNDGYDSEGNYQSGLYPQFDSELISTDKYFTIDFDLKLENAPSGMYVTSAGGAQFASATASANLADWTHFRLVVDNTDQTKENTTSGSYSKNKIVTSLYIDGVYSDTTKNYNYVWYYKNDDASKTIIPIRFVVPTNEDGNATMYLKNVEITPLNANPLTPSITTNDDIYTVTVDSIESNAAILVAQFDADGVFQGITKGAAGEGSVSVSSTNPKLEAYVMNLTSLCPKYTSKAFGSGN